MKVAIVHYHLQSGGVTRIIEHTAAALAGSNISLVVLTGQEPGPDFPAPFKVIPELQYEANRPDTTVSNLAQVMKKAARESLGGCLISGMSIITVWGKMRFCRQRCISLPVSISTCFCISTTLLRMADRPTIR